MKPESREQEDPPFPSLTTTSETYAHELYRDVVEEEDIERFLNEQGRYDSSQARWSIPAAPTTTERLVESCYAILSSIVRRFVKSTEPGVERDVVNTIGSPECEEKDEEGRRVCPVLVVKGAGPSFQLPTSIQPEDNPSGILIGYTNMATFFSVKLDSKVRSPREEVDEMAPYARRIFRSQPNRLFVRCIALTERYARLIHFDRGGAEITPPFDFHERPSTLVRLVIGLASPDEARLGFDSSVQWTISNGTKGRGTLATIDQNGRAKTYPILEQLRTSRHSMHGRATTCWRVQDPDTLELFVVKDSWQPADRPGEPELLELVKGVPGVVQMVAYETGRPQLKHFRCPTTVGQYQNRVAMRVMLESYGPSIEHFTSAPEMLCALRDAIAGHQKLTSDAIGILHRDVSVYTVLLGKPGAPVGERGVLIDLDLAFKATEANPTVKANYNVGIRMFQPISALDTLYIEDQALAHDYLDDLESFFYLLIYLFLIYQPDGTRVLDSEAGPTIIDSWNGDDPSLACTNKERLFGFGSIRVHIPNLVDASWGCACRTLFQRFLLFMEKIRNEKVDMGYAREEPERPGSPSLQGEHYSNVLAMFDEAIEAVKPSQSAPGEPTRFAAYSPPQAAEAPAVRSCDAATSSDNPEPLDSPSAAGVPPPSDGKVPHIVTAKATPKGNPLPSPVIPTASSGHEPTPSSDICANDRPLERLGNAPSKKVPSTVQADFDSLPRIKKRQYEEEGQDLPGLGVKLRRIEGPVTQSRGVGDDFGSATLQMW